MNKIEFWLTRPQGSDVGLSAPRGLGEDEELGVERNSEEVGS
jgi:hypothetical protein